MRVSGCNTGKCKCRCSSISTNSDVLWNWNQRMCGQRSPEPRSSRAPTTTGAYARSRARAPCQATTGGAAVALPRARRRKIWRRQVRPPAIPAVGGVSSRDGRRGATAAFQPGGRRYGLGRAGRPAWPSMHGCTPPRRHLALLLRPPVREGEDDRSAVTCCLLALRCTVPSPILVRAQRRRAKRVALPIPACPHSTARSLIRCIIVQYHPHGTGQRPDSGLATSPPPTPRFAAPRHHQSSSSLGKAFALARLRKPSDDPYSTYPMNANPIIHPVQSSPAKRVFFSSNLYRSRLGFAITS